MALAWIVTIYAADHEKSFDFFSGMCYLQYTIRERRIGVRVWRNEESVIWFGDAELSIGLKRSVYVCRIGLSYWNQATSVWEFSVSVLHKLWMIYGLSIIRNLLFGWEQIFLCLEGMLIVLVLLTPNNRTILLVCFSTCFVAFIWRCHRIDIAFL